MLKSRLLVATLFLFSSPIVHARNCSEAHLLENYLNRNPIQISRATPKPDLNVVQGERSEALESARKEFAELKLIAEGKAEATVGPRSETLESYIALAEKREKDDGVIKGELVDPVQQDQASKTWKPKPAPPMFEGLLPEGVGFVSHGLRDAMSPGVVKADVAGGFVTLRVSVPIRRASGEVVDIETNIGVHVGALLANAGKPPSERKLVSPDMEWVAITNHGVGTKGTGHHVEIEKIHYFFGHRIGVIGMDSPWHGEGSTKLITPQEEFQFVAKFLEKYAPKNLLDQKRVAYGGHSGGGQRGFAAMNNPGPLEKYVGFYFPLSPGMDVAPGKGLRDKELEHQRREKIANETRADEQSKSDKEIGRSLVAGDKLSQTAMLGYYLFTAGSDYIHRKPSPVPTLFVDGKADALVKVGFEDLRAKFVQENPNIIYLVMGKRTDVKGNTAEIGHIIQDNKRPAEMPPEYDAHPWLRESFDQIKTSETEVYGLMRVLMERIGGKKLEPLPPLSTQAGLMARVVSSWANNLAFREFARQFVHYKYTATANGERAQKVNEILTASLKKIDRLEANKGLTDEQKAAEIQKVIREEIPTAVEERIKKISEDKKLTAEEKHKEVQGLREALTAINTHSATASELKAKFEEAFGIMTHTYVPEGPMKAEAEKNLALRKEMDQFRRAATETKDKVLARLNGGPRKKFQDDLIVELRQVSGTEVVRKDPKGVETVQGLLEMKTEADKQVRLTLAAIEKANSSDVPANYSAAKILATEAFNRAAQKRHEFENSLTEYIFELQEKNAITWENVMNIPAPVKATMEAYSASVKEFRDRQLEVAHLLESEGISGAMGAEVQALLVRQKRVREAVDKYMKESNDLEYAVHRVTVQGHLLKKDYIERIVPGNSNVVVTHLWDIFQLPISEWQNHMGVIEPAWNRWKTLWGERPPPEKIELY